MATATTTVPVKFHISLNVADLAKSIAYYKILFGVEPAKARHDYAKFETDDPPLVLSLEPTPRSPGGALNHLGLRVGDSEALVDAQRRLEAAGIVTQREEGVACCYARQTKFWTHDPDHNLWEIYILHEDLEERGMGSQVLAAESKHSHAPAPKPTVDLQTPAKEAVRWHHILTDAIPERIDRADASVDEVHLQGTFNKRVEPAMMKRFLADVYRVVKPGGTVSVHALVGAKPFPGKPTLPGPAAMVEAVLQEAEPMQALLAAGFTDVQFTKLAETPCFMLDGIEMREMKLVAHKPATGACNASREVLYKGPLSQMTDDAGHVFPRGQRVALCDATCEALRSSGLADQFVFFPQSVTLRASCS
jgi:catechol 2,3-dioxygenase-like lactoylglutathione lyase family enzyme